MAKFKEDYRKEEYYWSQVRKHGAKYPTFNWYSVEIFLNLAYTYDVVTGNLTNKITPFGVTRGGLSVLMMLSRSQNKECKQSEISRLMLVSRANITGLVDSLFRKGLVERSDDPYDRRVNLIKISPKGEKLLDALLPEYYKSLDEICSIFSDKEKTMFNHLLTRLRSRTSEV